MYAHDAKLYLKIVQGEDCRRLQKSINNFVDNCKLKKIKLNENKCEICTFSRTNNTIVHDYKLGDVNLVRVSETNDLGVKFHIRLNVNLLIDHSISTSKKTLGFISRTCKLN